MADITMCTNKDCDLAFSCYRFKAAPSPYWQSYQHFTPHVDEVLDEIECEHYVEYQKDKLDYEQ